jgi:uroporphyrinogen decarboxylase
MSNTITPKQRMLDLIAGRSIDIRPIQLDFSPLMLSKMYAHFGIPPGAEEDLLPFIDNHFVYAFLNDPFGAQRRHTYTSDILYDDWGIGWDMRQEGLFMVNHPLGDDMDLDHYRFPDPNRPGLLDNVQPLLEKYGETHLVCSYQVTGLNERASALRGYEEWMVDIAGDPEYAVELLDHIMDYQTQLAKNYIAAGVTCGRYGDDYGTQQGMLMSPKCFRELFKPRLAKIFALYKDAGLPLVYHSCGDIRPIIDDLIEIGVDILNNVQPEAMPRKELAENFGDRNLVFYGGISTQQVLRTGTPMEIESEVRDCMATLGKRGRWIMSTGISITSDVDIERVDTLLQTINKLRYE